MKDNIRWSPEKANAWYESQGWIVGANFIPSTAVNQLEMWQVETFDPATIRRELGYAKNIGLNTARVFLHNLLWESDRRGFIERIDAYLSIANSLSIKTIFVLLDGVWNPKPQLGVQPNPIPFLHNSAWVQSPGADYLGDPAKYSRIEDYVKGVIDCFARDPRILMWDLFNEPDNANYLFYRSTELKRKNYFARKLLAEAFSWARQINPAQPLTSAAWGLFVASKNNKFVLSSSDVVTFHSYRASWILELQIRNLKRLGRPTICTEYMARPRSNFRKCLPIMKKHNVGAVNWGLVSGRTQTIYPWSSWVLRRKMRPKVWFHDIFEKDGEPYDATEISLIRELVTDSRKEI